MLGGDATSTAQRPQCILQAFRERHKALAAEYHMGMFEAGERQPEVVEPMIERLACDGDAEPAHVGKVRQAQPSRRMLLAKDHVAVGTVERTPAGDPAPRSAAPPGRCADRNPMFRRKPRTTRRSTSRSICCAASKQIPPFRRAERRPICRTEPALT